MNTIAPIKKPKTTYVEVQPPRQPKRGQAILLFMIVSAAIFAAINWSDYVVENAEGKLELAPIRKAKLEKELDEIDNAVQYALVAQFSGEYPCLNCGSRTTIFLNVGDVWKYGTTRVGEKVRYQSNPYDDRLQFVSEFAGNYAECLKVEKIKIYNYVLSTENQKRDIPIIRPPGNPYDI